MTNPAPQTAIKRISMAQSIWRWAIAIAFFGFLLASTFVWLVPLEVFEQWAFDRAGSGPFDKFEAVGKAEFLVWSGRVAGLLLLISIGRMWWNVDAWFVFFADAWNGLDHVTSVSPMADFTKSRSFVDRLRTTACRGFLFVWMLVFASHLVQAIDLRAHDWPFFRFHSGDVVLPNISESNRAVIRYLQEATPSGSRILVASDQKLFFLSYYLRPRTLFHRMHPDSEHVIPLKDQQRKLRAYRLDELTPADLEQMPHDYTLEYFEHPELVDQDQIRSDAAWIAFLRRREKNPSLVPSYQVRLRKSGDPHP